MTSRQRVRSALAHHPSDRVPAFVWFHPVTVARLSALLDVPPADVADVMGNDIRQTWVGNNQAMEGVVHEHEGETHTDAWGVTWVKEGHFNQVLTSPLADADPEAVATYAFPHAAIPELLAAMERVPRGDAFIGCDVSPCLFELLCRLRGMENAAVDLVSGDASVERLLEHATSFGVALAEEACDRWHPDWLWTGDDVAGQQSLIMSPAVWRARLRPRLARIVQVGKQRGLPVAYHGCGAVRSIIPDLVEMGVDVLNPVQTTCPGMDPRELQREFGSVLSFMGGIDTLDLLPNGSPEEVYAATRGVIETLGANGGYILSASHTVPPETPDGNIFAMFRAAGTTREEIHDRAAVVRRERAAAIG